MKMLELYRDVVTRYSEEISLADTILFPNGAARIPELIEEHDRVSLLVEDISRQYEAMDWTVYQILHREGMSLFQKGQLVLNPHIVEPEDLVSRFNENNVDSKDDYGIDDSIPKSSNQS